MSLRAHGCTRRRRRGPWERARWAGGRPVGCSGRAGQGLHAAAPSPAVAVVGRDGEEAPVPRPRQVSDGLRVQRAHQRQRQATRGRVVQRLPQTPAATHQRPCTARALWQGGYEVECCATQRLLPPAVQRDHLAGALAVPACRRHASNVLATFGGLHVHWHAGWRVRRSAHSAPCLASPAPCIAGGGGRAHDAVHGGDGQDEAVGQAAGGRRGGGPRLAGRAGRGRRLRRKQHRAEAHGDDWLHAINM